MSDINPGQPVPAEEVPAQPQQVSVRFPNAAPWVTYTIMAATILVFLAQVVSKFFLGFDLPAAIGLKVNELIVNGQLWRLFTPMLLHGSILHIMFNMYALYAIGPFLEKTFGARRFFLLYLVGGFAGNVLSFIFTDANSLGASTAIFGVFGAQGIFIYQNRQLFGEQSREMINRIVMLAVINLLIGLQGNIDNWGHIGGLIGGVVYTWFAGPKLAVKGMAPEFFIKDEREKGGDFTAALGLGLVFAILAFAGVALQ